MKSPGMLMALGFLIVGLPGCKEERNEAAVGKGAAAGEILPQSINDDMLPYDRVRSQPPLAATASGPHEGEDVAPPSDQAGQTPDGGAEVSDEGGASPATEPEAPSQAPQTAMPDAE